MINKKRYNHGYKIYKKYTINHIFENIDNDNSLPDQILYHSKDYDDSLKRVNIIKKLIERDGQKCIYCNEKPQYFGLGKDNAGYWHLDLYSKKDKENYMYTIDHIHPKSKGGLNQLDNYQLLCKVCNENKSDTVEGEEETEEEKTKKVLKKTFNYIGNKLSSLDEQTKGILSKIKNHDVICIKNQENFTIGMSYNILDISVIIDDEFNSHYKFLTKNDNDIVEFVEFKNFLTKKDSDYYINKKFNNY